MGDSCGLRISSNSLELLLKMGIFDFLSPCFVGLGFVSGDISFERILGGFISDILGVLCSCTGSSCSLPGERSLFLLNFIVSGDGTSFSDLIIDFSRFVRSFDVLFSIALVISLQLSPVVSQSFTSKLPTREFSTFDNVLSSKLEFSNGSR